jgi:nucleoside-diphosphate-sugar epimerase
MGTGENDNFKPRPASRAANVLSAAQPQSILVTGGGGFIGSHLVRHLCHRGHRVTAVDDLSLCGNWRRLEFAHDQTTLVENDLFDIDLLQRLLKPVDVVVHCAGVDMTWPPQTLREQLAVHATGTLNLLESAHRAHVRRLIHIGWIHPPTTCDRQAAIYTFRDTIIDSFHHDTDLDTAVLRVPFVFGPGQYAIHPTLTPVASLIHNLLHDVTPQLIAEPTQPIELTNVREVAAAVVELCEVDLLPSQIALLPPTETITMGHLIDELTKHLHIKRPQQFRQLRSRRREPYSDNGCCNDPAHIVPINRSYLADGLADTVQWWIQKND